MIIPAYITKNKTYYIVEQDFNEYLMEQSAEEDGEIWGLLKDYIRQECE